MALVSIVIAIVIHIYVTCTYVTVGQDYDFKEKPMRIYDHYAGKYIGKILFALTILFCLLGAGLMISGFGAGMQQYFGIPQLAGSAIMGVLCTLTVVLGLKRIVDVLGSFGPLLIMVSLLCAGTFLLQNINQFSAGLDAIKTIEFKRIGDNWFISGIYYATWAPVIVAPFLVASARTVNNKKEAVWGMVLGNIFYGLATALVVMAFMTDIAAISKTEVPLLYMASKMGAIYSIMFFILLIVGIYTSVIPGMTTFCLAFFKDGSKNYRLLAVAMGTVVTFGASTLRFSDLINIVYGVYSKLGIPFVLLLLAHSIYNIYRNVKSDHSGT